MASKEEGTEMRTNSKMMVKGGGVVVKKKNLRYNNMLESTTGKSSSLQLKSAGLGF